MVRNITYTMSSQICKTHKYLRVTQIENSIIHTENVKMKMQYFWRL